MAETAFERRDPDDHRVRRLVASTTFAVCGGFAAVFLFFAAMGAIDVADAVVLTIVAIVLGLVWFAGFIYRQSTEATRTQWRDRERRGF
jgi:fatty acid desaturase